MAMTATATQDTLNCMTEHLSSENPTIIGLPPNRLNIKYIIEKSIEIPTFCHQLVNELMIMRIQMPKTATLQNCATFFATIKWEKLSQIHQEFGHMECRLVEDFIAVFTPKMREAVLKEFCKPQEVLVATTAFGMGIDCPDIDIIINWGCPNTLEELVQETGRGERDGCFVKLPCISVALIIGTISVSGRF